MTTERINTMVEEVIELDPSLRVHEESLRTFIAHMEEVRPDVTIDPAFIAALRSHLITQGRPTPSPYANISWWALRLMPIGAIALVLLVLVPGTPTTKQPRSVIEMISSDPRIIDIQIGDTTSAPPPVERYGLGGSGGVSPESASSMTQKSMVADEAVQTLTVPPQTPGQSFHLDTLTVEAPSFLVIHSTTPEGEIVLGASPLLPKGTTDNLTIILRTQMIPSGSYRAVLYRDNGDQVFTLEDPVGYDPYGNMLSTPIQVVLE